MKRHIVKYHQNKQEYWVAELDCGHKQNLRHNPPFIIRPWVKTVKGRQDHLGSTVNCAACDELRWPEGLTHLRQTPEFTDTEFPVGLAKNHATKAGVWGLLHILDGSLEYVVQEPAEKTYRLQKGDSGIIPPTMLHHVRTNGPVRFYVEFFTLAATPNKVVDHVQTKA